jgi:hypothetical protein
VCGQSVGHHLGQRDRPSGPHRFWRHQGQGIRVGLVRHADRAAQEVNVINPQAEQLTDPQA